LPVPPCRVDRGEGLCNRPNSLGRGHQRPIARRPQRNRSEFSIGSRSGIIPPSRFMKFRAVLFDAAETLFTTRGSVGEIYASIARQFGSQASSEAIQTAFAKHFRGSGPISVTDQKEWWKEI